jgi:AraC-like DNA-binding protein
MRHPGGGLVERARPLVFSTAELPRRQRLDAWNGAFGRLNEIRVRDAERGEHLVRGEHWLFGGMVLGVNRIPAATFERDALRVRRDGMDHWAIRVLRRGRCRANRPGRSALLEPGQPFVFPLDETWTDEWSDAEWVSLTVPRDLNPNLSAAMAAPPTGLMRGPAAAVLGQTLLALPAHLEAASAADLPALAEVTQAMLIACLRTGAADAAIEARESRKERVRQAIRQQISSARLTPGRLAAMAGISRSALYRLFEDEGGIARLIQDTRLARAHAALTDPSQGTAPIADVAARHGFPDPSSFTRAFRRAFGVTPRGARASSAGVQVVRWPVQEAGADLAARLYGRALS